MPRKKGSTNKNQSVKRRKDESTKDIQKEATEYLIRECFAKKVSEESRRPQAKEIAEELNLHINTVSKYLKEIKFEPAKDELRVLTPKVLEAIYKSAEAGNSGAQKLWLETMEGQKVGGGGLDNKNNDHRDSTDTEEEEQIQERFRKELLGKLNVLEIVIARIAYKRDIPSHYLLWQLKNSWYSKYTVLQGKGNDEEDYYPSDDIYNFDEIKEKAEEKSKHKEEIKSRDVVELDDNQQNKAKSERDKVLEKLSKGKKK